MYNRLPLEIIFSLLFWASMIFTIISSIQLMIFERILKKSDFQRSSYKTMTPESKKVLYKLLLRIAIGLTILIVFIGASRFRGQ